VAVERKADIAADCALQRTAPKIKTTAKIEKAQYLQKMSIGPSSILSSDFDQTRMFVMQFAQALHRQSSTLSPTIRNRVLR
jgi:hypothetical protein